MTDFIKYKKNKYNDTFKIILSYSEREYETKIQLIEHNSNQNYIVDNHNFLNIELYGGINLHKDVPYIGLHIFNDWNKRSGIGTILLDTLFDFIIDYNSNKSEMNKIHYVMGSISSNTITTWYEAITFYLHYKYLNIVPHIYSSSIEVFSANEFIKLNNEGKIIFDIITTN